ncbi:putative o-methyltransferase 3 [Quercus suber]|uniref:O-methyltransferase 3 n=1 Tax=Quercus suber TaxID=58331 RepID=A0AAW0JKF0_QUESU
MVRGLGFTAGLTVLIALLLLVPPTYCSNPPCAHSSSCGNIPNISFPFRLNSDPQNCGDSRYVLSCDENNLTVLYLYGGKYFVQEISYNNCTIRMVDSSIRKDNYFSFSTPTYSLYQYNFSFQNPLNINPIYTTYQPKMMVSGSGPLQLSRSLALMSSEKPVNSPLYLDTSTCNYNDNSSSISDSKSGSKYFQAFSHVQLMVFDLPHIDIVASLPESKRMNYVVGDMLVSIPFVDAFLIKFIGEVCVQKKTPQNNLETNFDISTPIEKMKIQVQSTKCRRRLSEAEEETRLFLCK